MQLQIDKLGKVAITVEQGYWSNEKDYDRLTIVEAPKGEYKTYISRKPVPAGTVLTNREYWIPFSSLKEEIVIDFNEFVASLTEAMQQTKDYADNTIEQGIEDITAIKEEAMRIITYIAENGIDSTVLAPNSVTGDKIAPKAVGGEHLAPNSVTTDKLADDTITELTTIMDSEPVEDSVKPIQSGGVFEALMDRVIMGDIVGDPAAAWEPGTAEAYIDQRINEQNNLVNTRMDRQDIVIKAYHGNKVILVDTLPESGEEETIYRVPASDHYTDYMWDTSLETPAFTAIATFDFPGVDDVPTEGSNRLVKSGGVYATYAPLRDSIDGILGEVNSMIAEAQHDINTAISEYAPIIIEGDVTNAADEEDITSVDEGGGNVLKLKNKSYAPLLYSGLGRVYLRKNIVNDVNILTQTMFSDSDTIYSIQYDYDLNGEDIEIPDGSVLEFKGGSFKNGTLIGNNTSIVYNTPCFENIEFSGTWNVPDIYSWMLKDIMEEDKLRTLFKLQNPSVYNNIYVENADEPYIIIPSGSTAKAPRDGIDIFSNTFVHNNGVIKIASNGQYGYTILNIKGDNIVFNGGEIVGDKDTHDYSASSHPTHEWGHGIYTESATKYVTIKNVHVHDCTGDGISLSGSLYNVDNVKVHDCRRQGITIANLNNATISNFEIYTIVGVAPKSAIDVEPNSGEASRITIRNGTIYNTDENVEMSGIVVLKNNLSNLHDITISDIRAINVIAAVKITGGVNVKVENINVTTSRESESSIIRFWSGCKNIYASNIEITAVNTSVVAVSCFNSSFGEIVFENCRFIREGETIGGEALYARDCIFKHCVFKGYNRLLSYFKTIDREGHYNEFYDCTITSGMQACFGERFIKCNISNEDTAESNVLIGTNSDYSFYFKDCYFNLDISLLSLRNGDLKMINCTFERKKKEMYDYILYGGNATAYFKNCKVPQLHKLWDNATTDIIISDYGNTVRRPVKDPSSVSEQYYDTDISKPIFLSYIRSVSPVTNSATVYGQQYTVIPNPFTEGSFYTVAHSGATSVQYYIDIYAATSDSAEAKEDDLLLITSWSHIWNVVYFQAPDPTIYPYIKMYYRRSTSTILCTFYELNPVYLDSNGFIANKSFGTTAEREAMTSVSVGFMYFDTDLNKPVYWTGSTWVDSLGNNSDT